MQTIDKTYKWLIFMGLVLAFLLRLGYVLTIEKDVYWVDEEDYMALGQSIAQGDGYVNALGEPTAFRPPGYPLLLSGLYKLGIHNPPAIRVVQVLLGVFTIFLLALIALRYMGPAVAFLSVITAAGYPYFIYMTGTVLATTWFSMTLVASVYFLLAGEQENRSLKIVASGLLMGLSILTRSSAAVLGVAVLGWLMMRRPRLLQLKYAILFAFCMSLVVAPWMWRNYRTLGSFGISTNGGRNLWLGNNPESTINTGSNIAMPKDLEERVDAVSEVEADRIYTEEAKRYIAANPKHFVILSLKKGLSLWRFDPSPTTKGYSRLQKLYPLASIATYTPIFCFTILGLFMAGREQKRVMLLWVFFGAAFTLLHALFIAKVRFRLPLDHFMIVMAAFGFTALVQRTALFRRFWHKNSQTGIEYESASPLHNIVFTRRL